MDTVVLSKIGSVFPVNSSRRSCYECGSRRGDFASRNLSELRTSDSGLGNGIKETIKTESGFGYEGILGTMPEVP
jgi:hypothetical protein